MAVLTEWEVSSTTSEISISYNQNAFDTLILSITDSPAFNGYEVCKYPTGAAAY